MKNKKSAFLIFFTIITFFFSLFNFNIVKAEDLNSPKAYYKWTQNGSDMPWVKKGWGTQNVMCYLTSIGIQGARAGMAKAGNGKTWNPWEMYVSTGNSAAGQPSYKGTDKDGNKVEFKSENYSAIGGDCTQTPSFGPWSKQIAKIIEIEKAGKYPIVHVSSATGYSYGTHYMAVRDVKKKDGSDITLYDPARGVQGGDTIKQMGGWGKFKQNKVSFAADITAWSGGPIKFYGKGWGAAPASKTDQNDVGNESPEDTGDSSENMDGKGYGRGVPKIKPIFNPFRQKAPDNTYIGYDTEGNEKAYKRSRIVNMINIYLPKILSFIRILTYMIMYGFIAYAILSLLIFTADVFLGGLIQNACDKIPHDSFFRKFFFPGDGSDFMGFNASRGWSINILMSHIKMLIVIVLICGLISTNSLSYILGTIFYKLGNWLTF